MTKLRPRICCTPEFALFSSLSPSTCNSRQTPQPLLGAPQNASHETRLTKSTYILEKAKDAEAAIETSKIRRLSSLQAQELKETLGNGMAVHCPRMPVLFSTSELSFAQCLSSLCPLNYSRTTVFCTKMLTPIPPPPHLPITTTCSVTTLLSSPSLPFLHYHHHYYYSSNHNPNARH